MNRYKLWDEWTTGEPYLVDVDEDLEYIEDLRTRCIYSGLQDDEEYSFLMSVLNWLDDHTMASETYGAPFNARVEEIEEEARSLFTIEIEGID